jgi:hypothetical protein
MASRDLSLAPPVLGLVSALVGCEEKDPCDGLRTFDPPPEPEPSDTAPPTLLDGEWIGAGVLELSFSKPLLPGSPPDPTRFAVVGWSAIVQPYGGYYGSGSADSCQSTTRYSMIGVGYYSRAVVTDVWVAPEDPTLLRLRMSNTGADCRTINDIVGEGVMLVYANGGDAGTQLLDADGDPVPDIGPAWAIAAWEPCVGSVSYGYYYNSCGYALNNSATGQLPAMTSMASIPCPT